MAPSKTPGRPAAARPSIAGRAVRVVALLAIGMLVGRWACGPATSATDAPAPNVAPSAAATQWTCSMHPQVRLPEPGQCPICFMDLVPVTSEDDDDTGPRTLTLSETAAALADIETAPVERRAVVHDVPLVGRVAYDESRLAHITAWVPGRLERLFVDYTGVRVRTGDHMVELYSPQLIATQKQLLAAMTSAGRLEESPVEIVRGRAEASAGAARERLRLWGLEASQIDAIIARGEPLERVTINAPVGGIVVHKSAVEGAHVETGTRIYTIADLSRVWVLLDAYESDLAWLHYGQDVEFATEAYPGETFHGRIAFIDPVLDDRTRTIKARVNVDNADGRLKPDMFVRATVKATLTVGGLVVDPDLAEKWMCPMHPEVVAAAEDDCSVCGMDLVPTAELGYVAASTGELPLTIPATAPLVTGRRAVVYVRVAGDRPTFEGREVTLGPRAGDRYVVADGLQEGEQVVVRGAFKIDSELQIQAKPSMMSPADAAPSGHRHHEANDHAQHGSASGEPFDDVPTSFREELGALADHYVAAQIALAADDAGAARASAAAFVGALDEVGDAGLSEAALHAWDELRPAMAAAARRVADAHLDVGAQRRAFLALGDGLTGALDRFGYARATELTVVHCPMAFDDAGGAWLQDAGEVANPYYGRRMLRCGDVVRALPREP